MARVITAGELVKLRSDGQWSRLYLAIHKPSTVYTARVNQTTFVAPAYQVTYDGGSGTLASVLPGMTMYVGSGAGLYDKGIVRIRKTPSATIFYIGETSEINWANDLYLTVVDEFNLWTKHLRLAGTTPYMDYDVAYSDQHTLMNPYPVLGPDAVLKLTEATVVFSPDASNSWVPGSTISSYLWVAPGASATANLDTATPTITYDTASPSVGYRVQCTVTAANGKTTVGYRRVFVYSEAAPPTTQFELLSCSGDFESGGWDFRVRFYAEAALSDIRDRARVILFAEDTYNEVAGSVGPIPGYENIIAAGWADLETLSIDPDAGTVDVTVRGPHFWLKNMTGFPTGIERTTEVSNAWTNMNGLTVDWGLWHLLYWRTTAPLCMDAYLPGSTMSLPVAEAPTTSLWGQLEQIAYQTILARPVCDRYGRFFCEVDTQFLPEASRTSPIVQEITEADWSGGLEVERRTSRRCSMLELLGILDDTSEPLMSRARGGVFTLYGTAQSVENLLLDNQAACNTLAGNYFSWLNNEYPSIDITLAANNRMIDVAPRQRVTLSISVGDTPRGIAWTTKKLLPRRVSFDYDRDAGWLTVELECEAETGGDAAIDGETVPISPPPIIGNEPYDFPDFDEWGSWPAILPPIVGNLPPFYPPQPPLPPDALDTCVAAAPANGPFDTRITGTLYGLDTYARFGSMPVVIRTTGHTNKSTYVINGIWEKFVDGAWVETSDDDQYSVYAFDAGGNLIATGAHDAVTNLRQRTGVLSAVNATEIRYISIQIDKELFRPTDVIVHDYPPVFHTLTPGTLKWGYTGAGMWASYLEAKAVCTWGAGVSHAFASSLEIVGTLTPVNSTLLFKQRLFVEAAAGAHIYDYVQGGTYDIHLDAGKWREEIAAPVSSYFSDFHEFTRVGIRDPEVEAITWAPYQGELFLSHFVTIRQHQTYRIQVHSMHMYNVCPITSWS